MEFSLWEELIFSISFTLGSIRDTVARTSLWRFRATQLGPLKGLPISVSLCAAPRPRPRPRPRARKRALALPLPSPSALSTPSALDLLSWLLVKQPVTADQTLSAFLTRLLQGVRTIIYEAVLGGRGSISAAVTATALRTASSAIAVHFSSATTATVYVTLGRRRICYRSRWRAVKCTLCFSLFCSNSRYSIQLDLLTHTMILHL
jgi:hypothetical protein